LLFACLPAPWNLIHGVFLLLEKLNKHRSWFIVLTALIALAVWQAVAWIWQLPTFILPTPLQVAVRFWQSWADGSLVRHLLTTLVEVLAGLTLGAGFATLTGYWLAKSRPAERLLSPYLVASQALPMVAIAPLLIIWFGSGLVSKILICALTVFFPVLINTIIGLRAVPDSLQELMRSLHATPRQTLRYLEVPAALPVFLGGLRVGATLSVIGAVVGEFVGSDRGLGFLINIGRGQYDTALVFAAIFTLIALALTLYYSVVWLEKLTLRWNSHIPSQPRR
jgi:NitT/TauT family transport system permease protein